MKKALFKALALTLSLAMNWLGLLTVGETVARYHDNAESPLNIFHAAELDIITTPKSFTFGLDLNETAELRFEISSSSDSLPFTHAGRFAWVVSSTGAFCAGLHLTAGASTTLGLINTYDGSLEQFISPATTTLGAWALNLAPLSLSSDDYGDTCEFDLIFDAAQKPYAPASTSPLGFSDHEKIHGTITARRQVVLNEILPNPLGDNAALQPLGEWVEIYNNGSSTRNLSGWYFQNKDNLDTVHITTENTSPATTTISGHSFVVVYMNQALFDNKNDSVELYNADGDLVDSFSYCGQNIAPNGNGVDCLDKTAGASWARIPDGVGTWIDPVPTPGMPNISTDGIDGVTTEMQDLAMSKDAPEPAIQEDTFATTSSDGIATSTETGTVVEDENKNLNGTSTPTTTPEIVATSTLPDPAPFPSTLENILAGQPEEWDANTTKNTNKSNTSDTPPAPQDTPAEKHLSSPVAQEEEGEHEDTGGKSQEGE